jgi:hypothetical protein
MSTTIRVNANIPGLRFMTFVVLETVQRFSNQISEAESMNPSFNNDRDKVKHSFTVTHVIIAFHPFEEMLSRQNDVRETWKIRVRWAKVRIVHDNFSFDMSTFTRLFV